MRGRLAAAALTLLFAGCASPQPSELPTPTAPATRTTAPTSTPAPTPAPSAPEWFGEALIVVGSTGEFSEPAARTEELPAWMVVWRDGLVVTTEGPRDQPPVFSSAQLTDSELADLQAMLGTADLADYEHVPGEGDHVTCQDCNDAVIQLDIEGRFVEIIVPLLRTTGMSYPPPVVEIIGTVLSLGERASRSASPWTGSMPTILAAPLLIGG